METIPGGTDPLAQKLKETQEKLIEMQASLEAEKREGGYSREQLIEWARLYETEYLPALVASSFPRSIDPMDTPLGNAYYGVLRQLLSDVLPINNWVSIGNELRRRSEN